MVKAGCGQYGEGGVRAGRKQEIRIRLPLNSFISDFRFIYTFNQGSVECNGHRFDVYQMLEHR